MLPLQATQNAIETRDYEKLKNIIQFEKAKIPHKPCNVEYDNIIDIQDDLANSVIPFDIPYPNEDVCAIKVTGNGNCLFNSLSYLLCQSPELAVTLRVLTAAELFMNSSKYTNHPKFMNC